MHYKQEFKLLTFYKFVDIKDPQEEMRKHYSFCYDIGMKGRVYIGEEGISATMTCSMGQYQAYKYFLAQNPYFNDIDHIEKKWTSVDGHKFDKMIVKYRKEIVALGETVTEEEVKQALQEISMEELKDIIDNEKEGYAILDMRNTYEYKLGHFKGAEPAGTINFRDVDDMFESYKQKYMNKKVIMYCTGGIRCEKLNVLCKKKGLDNFYALKDGVIGYTNKFGDGNWLGSLYTFDGVISTRVNPDEKHTTIGVCIYTGHHTDNTENCRYSPCNARIIARKKNYKQHAGFCSQECYDNAKKDGRVKNDFSFDSTDYKALRSLVKRGEITTEELCVRTAKGIDKVLEVQGFNHKKSQKEDIVDQEMIKSCMT